MGNGQIAELANDWDGYSGVIPKSSATVAEVLRNYGYKTAAFGKWHNTPAEQTTASGPFEYWPAGYGFEYFYGFLAGEASQYEPNLVRNTTIVPPPRTLEQGYHLTEDLANDAIGWLRKHKAFEPDKPFFMYWASGAIHGPHHIMKEWADKYKGKFDDGWDNYRERVFKCAKEIGWIPASAQLTARPETLASWESIPEDEKPFQRRLMEVAAGYAEHVDHHVGRIVDEVDRLGYADNTLIFYIWGDNGSSSEGQNGTISEMLAQNGIPTTVPMHIKALNAWAAWTCSVRPRPTTSTTPGGPGLAARLTKGRSSLPRTSAARATPWPSDGRRGSSPTRRTAPSSTTSTTWSRRFTKLSASLLRAWSTASRKIRSTAPALLTLSATRLQRDASSPSISRSWAVEPCTMTAGWLRPSARGPRGFRARPPVFASGLPTRTGGNYTISRKTGRRPTISLARFPKSSPI